ncbi:MAG: hypothetical protein R8K53_02380, partial [Mariprofundaceae bacterium]
MNDFSYSFDPRYRIHQATISSSACVATYKPIGTIYKPIGQSRVENRFTNPLRVGLILKKNSPYIALLAGKKTTRGKRGRRNQMTDAEENKQGFIELAFENSLWVGRWAVLLAVIGGMLTSAFMFYIASIDVYYL